MAEDPQPMTLQQRIAALNAAHIGRVPGDSAPLTPRTRPEIPSKRPPITKHHSVNIPHENVISTVSESTIGNQPNGPPPQLPARRQPPPLPSRDSSEQSSRRPSVASTTSVATTDTTSSRLTGTRTKAEDKNRIKAPPWGAPEVPVLPVRNDNTTRASVQLPERPKHNSRVPSFSNTATAGQHHKSNTSSRTPLPPPLPTRRTSSGAYGSDQSSENVVRKLPPVPSAESIAKAKRAAFSYNLDEQVPQPEPQTKFMMHTHKPSLPQELTHKPSLPQERPTMVDHSPAQPPPVPLSSRPDLAAIQATKPKFAANTNTNLPVTGQTATHGCMVCRDFSQPDAHAARFPRQTVSSLPDLAVQLTAPFASLTDKARTIFTWLHHNISYDVVSFFNDNVRGSTPQSTLQSGLAVCEGYAALFTNLATHAGMESVVISGHGKGFGYKPLAPGSSIPPFKASHAWNAVRIDGGEWKLIDPCWGAGHVQGKGLPYVPSFNPSQFTMSNEEFGIRHFPTNKSYFFLPGGRQMTWEMYMSINPERWPYDCERPTLFTNAKTDYTIGERTVLPYDGKIRVNDPGTVRFQFSLLCPHWTLDRHTKKGLPPVFFVAVHGVDGRKEDYFTLDHARGSTPGGGGDFWYADIPARELGASGQKLTLFAVTSFADRKNARGLSIREFKQGKGKVAMSFAGVIAWELV